MNKYVRVESISHLKQLINRGFNEFFVLLVGGVKSSKYIEISDKKIFIFNYIDDTTEEFSVRSIKNTPIKEYIDKKSFYVQLR